MLRVILTNDMDVAVDADFFEFKDDEVRLFKNDIVAAKFERKYVMGVYEAVQLSCTIDKDTVKFEQSYPLPYRPV